MKLKELAGNIISHYGLLERAMECDIVVDSARTKACNVGGKAGTVNLEEYDEILRIEIHGNEILLTTKEREE